MIRCFITLLFLVLLFELFFQMFNLFSRMNELSFIIKSIFYSVIQSLKNNG